MTKFAVYWDNGAHDCGTFPERFDSYELADQWAANWVAEMNARDGIKDEWDGYYAEVIEAVE